MFENLDGDDVDNQEEEEYTVERIVGYRYKNGKHEFLVKWLGYAEPNWEERHNLNCRELVRDFFAREYRKRMHKTEESQTIPETPKAIEKPNEFTYVKSFDDNEVYFQHQVPWKIFDIDPSKNEATVYNNDDDTDLVNYPLDKLLELYPSLVCQYFIEKNKK